MNSVYPLSSGSLAINSFLTVSSGQFSNNSNSSSNIMETRVDVGDSNSSPIKSLYDPSSYPSSSSSSSATQSNSNNGSTSFNKRSSIHRVENLSSIAAQAMSNVTAGLLPNGSPIGSGPNSPVASHAPNSLRSSVSMSNPASRRDSLYQIQPSIWDREPVWIALYFSFNLALTLYNKIALNVFPYPWSLTAIHSACAAIGCHLCERQGYFKASVKLGQKETITLVAFSILYTVNIAVSNVSLNLVSVPLHQVIRSLTPLFTILLSVTLFKKSYLPATYLSLVPVIMGVALATHGDYSCSVLGFCLTVLSALLASIKGITTNRILVGSLKFHPLEFLMRMSPLSFALCIVFSLFTGEMSKIYDATYVSGVLTQRVWLTVIFNGAVAFGLNVVSFTANKKAGALTMDVAANVKQVLTIVLAVFVFDLTINFVNFVGIALTIAGGIFYSYVEFSNKKSNQQQTQQEQQQPLMASSQAYAPPFGKLPTSPLVAPFGTGNGNGILGEDLSGMGGIDDKIRLTSRGRFV